MNLLEHYIIEVKNIKVLQQPEYTTDEYLEVELLYDCWGNKRIVKHITTREDWERDLKRGYYLA